MAAPSTVRPEGTPSEDQHARVLRPECSRTAEALRTYAAHVRLCGQAIALGGRPLENHPCEDGHRLKPVRYWRGASPIDCAKPLRVECQRCDYVTQWGCGTSRESRCKPCAGRYRRRIRSIAFSGTIKREGGYRYLLTLSAPSDLGAHCMKPGCHVRDGRCAHAMCPCTPVGGVDLAEWNAGHQACWNRFRTTLRREHPSVEFMRGVEVQDGKRGGTARGALHDHVIVWSAEPLDVKQLRAWAMRAGYGHSVDLAEFQPGTRRAAYYVSKYVTKSADERAEVPWAGDVVDLASGEVTRGQVEARYRTWSQSQDWGDSMVTVRAAAAVYARAKREEEADAELASAIGLTRSALGGVLLSLDEPSPPRPP